MGASGSLYRGPDALRLAGASGWRKTICGHISCLGKRLRTGDVLLKAIRTTGCGPKLSGGLIYFTLYVLGFVIEEQSVGPSDGEPRLASLPLKTEQRIIVRSIRHW